MLIYNFKIIKVYYSYRYLSSYWDNKLPKFYKLRVSFNCHIKCSLINECRSAVNNMHKLELHAIC